MIDLRSDTLTRLNAEDLEALDLSRIGDDCYGEDDYVKELETYCCEIFGKEAALFMPSGTMSNQVALRCMANPGEEIITEIGYHISYFESSPVSALGGIVLNVFHSDYGILTGDHVVTAISSKARWCGLYSVVKGVAIESSINSYGGIIYPVPEINRIREICDECKMSLYMDGARILNSCCATGISPREYVKNVGIC